MAKILEKKKKEACQYGKEKEKGDHRYVK